VVTAVATGLETAQPAWAVTATASKVLFVEGKQQSTNSNGDSRNKENSKKILFVDATIS